MATLSCHSNQTWRLIFIKNTHFKSRSEWVLQMKNLVLTDQAASEEMSFESVNDADADDGRRTNAYPISSPGAFGSSELKSVKFSRSDLLVSTNQTSPVTLI